MKNIVEKLKNLGPGIIVVAGFIGPGTITTCSITGASFGYTLLWAVLFSIIATIVLQEMSARLGIVTQMGLGEVLRKKYTSKPLQIFLSILVISAIFIGNTAYEAGNITGALMGINAMDILVSKELVAITIGIISFILLYSGSYKKIEKVLIVLVIIMSALFIVTAIAVKPDILKLLKGLFMPTVPKTENAWIYVAGLVGTTVVPYNIYLHTSSASKKWSSTAMLPHSRLDTVLSITIGGLVSMCIVITSAVAFEGSTKVITNGADMAKQLEPLLGSWASYAMGFGLFAASLTSTITAPLSAAFATSGILGWGEDMEKPRFKAIWTVVLVLGIVAVCTLGNAPTQIILFSQAANAFLLPITTLLLILVCNDKNIMGKYKNNILSNILAISALMITVFIAVKNLYSFL